MSDNEIEHIKAYLSNKHALWKIGTSALHNDLEYTVSEVERLTAENRDLKRRLLPQVHPTDCICLECERGRLVVFWKDEARKLTAENAELRAEIERLGEQLGKMKYPETICTG